MSVGDLNNGDASGARQPPRPQPAQEVDVTGCRDRCKKFGFDRAGVRLSKDGRAVFNYKPGQVTAGFNIVPLLFSTVGRLFHRSWWYQYIGMCIICVLYAAVVSGESTKFDRIEGRVVRGPVDKITADNFETISKLSSFVLTFYISLSLARTYYANRSVFGTVFGSSMGFSQMVAAWVRSPSDDASTVQNARSAQFLLVRWVNAAFRLMVCEVRNMTPEEILQVMVHETQLLTESEWHHIESLPSRATHIYQWMNNVVADLQELHYIKVPNFACSMNGELDKCRGANVWGLPSLPLPYTIFVTALVKLHIVAACCDVGVNLHAYVDSFLAQGGYQRVNDEHLSAFLSSFFELFIVNFMYQGALDLHGVLYSPCGGEMLGSLPADNFLDFVQKVTTDMVSESGVCTMDNLPYSLKLRDADFSEKKPEPV